MASADLYRLKRGTWPSQVNRILESRLSLETKSSRVIRNVETPYRSRSGSVAADERTVIREPARVSQLAGAPDYDGGIMTVGVTVE